MKGYRKLASGFRRGPFEKIAAQVEDAENCDGGIWKRRVKDRRELLKTWKNAKGMYTITMFWWWMLRVRTTNRCSCKMVVSQLFRDWQKNRVQHGKLVAQCTLWLKKAAEQKGRLLLIGEVLAKLEEWGQRRRIRQVLVGWKQRQVERRIPTIKYSADVAQLTITLRPSVLGKMAASMLRGVVCLVVLGSLNGMPVLVCKRSTVRDEKWWKMALQMWNEQELRRMRFELGLACKKRKRVTIDLAREVWGERFIG